MSTSTSFSDREALERFREGHPELRTIAQIARVGEDAFLAQYGANGTFGGDLRLARRVYRQAERLNAQNALVWAMIKDAAASPHYGEALFNNIPQEFIKHLERIPGYQRLFGSLDFVACEHCRSILGPAAYFVDLMRFVKDFVEGDGNSTADAFLLDAQAPGQRRRPDLFTFPLDCSSTHELIPAIDLVNEILEAVVRSPEQPDPYRLLHDADFPLAVPFTRPLAEIRAYLGALGSGLGAIYRAFRALAGEDAVGLDGQIDREELGLAPREYALVAEEIGQPAELERLFGTVAGQKTYDLARLSSVPVFLEQTGLDRELLNELLYQDLDRDEVNAGLARLFFVNRAADGLGPLALEDGPGGPAAFDERLVNLSYAKLDRIYRFLRLARRLGWTFTELDMALRSLHPPFEPEPALLLDGVNDYVACRNVAGLDLARFTLEAWVSPAAGYQVIVSKGSLADRKLHFMLLINAAGRLELRYSGDAGDVAFVGANTVPDGVFSHVAVSVGDDKVRFYLNGGLDAAVDLAGKPRPTPAGADLDIGRDVVNFDSGYGWFRGVIKDVRVWEGARDGAAIAEERFGRLTGRERGLAAYWPLTDNPWGVMLDLGPSRNDGAPGGPEFITQPRWVRRDLVLDPLPAPLSADGTRFNGVDQYLIARGARGLGDAALTVEAHVRWEPARAKGAHELVAWGDEDSGAARFRLALRSARAGEARLELEAPWLPASRGKRVLTSARALPAGRLTPIAVVAPEAALKGSEFVIDAVLADAIAGLALPALQLYPAASPPSLREAVRGIAQTVAGPGPFLEQLAAVVGGALLAAPVGLPDGVVATLSPAAFIRERLSPAFAALAQGDAGLRLDDALLEDLLGPELPPAYHAALQGLQQPFVDADALVRALGAALGAEALAPHAAELLDRAERRYLRIYLDGVPEEFELGVGPIDLGGTGDTIVVGRALKGEPSYFRGTLGELRIWSAARSRGQIERFMHRAAGEREPGLAGYWRLGAAGAPPEGLAIEEDRSYYRNHLARGGEQAEYAPQREWAQMPLLPPPDVPVPGSALRFDGRGDRAMVQHPQNRGLGHYDRVALALWFRANDPQAGREQILAAQGDAEDGLALYIAGGAAHVACWANSYEGDSLQTLLFTSPPVQAGVWHHLAVLKDETVDPSAARYIAFLDGESFGSDERPFRLCPVGPLHLGDLPAGATVWTAGHGVYTAGAEGGPEHGFAGHVTDLRIIRAAPYKPAALGGTLALDVRYREAPALPDPSLLAYMPLIEAPGAALRDMAGPHTGAFFGARRVLAAAALPAGVEEAHADYADPASLAWSSYVYTGRMYVGAADSSLGVTFLSRRAAGEQRYYALARAGARAPFKLVAAPGTPATLGGDTDSGVAPDAGAWYRFAVHVTAAERRTQIRAKVWPDAADEPVDFQVDAFDASDLRLEAGGVGLWWAGGAAAFDDLRVRPIGPDGALGRELLASAFQQTAAGKAPDGWLQRATRAPDHTPRFETYYVRGTIAYGCDALDGAVYSHLATPEAMAWGAYELSGRLRVAEEGGGVGVSFLSQYPAGGEQLYRLGRGPGAAFALTAEPAGLQRFTGRTTTSVVPRPGAWYRFRVIVEPGADHTSVRARVWEAGETEPEGFQIEAVDASAARLRAGTIGAWAQGPGLKFVDGLMVAGVRASRSDLFTVVYSESFRPYGVAQRPAGWADQAPRERFAPRADLFAVAERPDGTPRWERLERYPVLLRPLSGYGLVFDGVRRYAASEGERALAAPALTFEAWVRPADDRGGPLLATYAAGEALPSFQIGIGEGRRPALSYVGADKSWLTLLGAEPLPAAAHLAVLVDGATATFVIDGRPGAPQTAQGPLLGAAPALHTVVLGRGVDKDGADGYFAGLLAEIRLWRGARDAASLGAGRYQQPEPGEALLAYWPVPPGEGLLLDDLAPGGAPLRLGGRFADRKPTFFSPAPVLSLPDDPNMFDPAALRLAGPADRVALPAPAPELTRPDELTFEVWVRPAALEGRAALWSQDGPGFELAFQDHRLQLRAGDPPREHSFAHPFDANAWAHIALVYRRAGSRVALYVNGELAEEKALGGAALALTAAQIGRDFRTQGDGLRGLLKELRLWGAARTQDEIRAALFRRLRGDEAGLALYRPFADEAPLEHAPRWASPDLLAEELGAGFWASTRKAASFDGAGGLVAYVAPQAEAAPMRRRSVEVWFRADAVAGSRRKQVIYHEGDQAQGLSIYLYDGALYFGGYSRLAEGGWGNWAGTWLKTDRVSAGRWHHAALVLDGRPELRASALRAYLDGKFVGEGAGAQLAAAPATTAVGGVGSSVVFHDGTVAEAPKPPPPPRADEEASITPELLDATALAFDGEVGTPVGLNPFGAFPSRQFTFECWVRPEAARHPGTLLSYAASGELHNALTLFLHRHRHLDVLIGNQAAGTRGQVELEPGAWQHLALTWSAGDGRVVVYRDAREVFSGHASAGAPIPAGGSLILGQDQDAPGGGLDPFQAFVGRLNEVRLWDHVRTPEEIGHDMRFRGVAPGLLAYWHSGPANRALIAAPAPAAAPASRPAPAVALAVGAPAASGNGRSPVAREAPAAPPPPAAPTRPEPPALTPELLDAEALTFDGSPDSLLAVRPFDGFPAPEMTVEAWLRPESASHPGTALSYATGRRDDNAFVLYLYRHRSLTVLVNGQTVSAAGVASLEPRRWTHIAVTWRAADGRIRIFKDGREAYTGFVSAGRPIANGGSLTLGQEQDRPGAGYDPFQAFKGRLSDLRFWDRVRTPEEIGATMGRRLAGDEPGLVYHWPPLAPTTPAPDAPRQPDQPAGPTLPLAGVECLRGQILDLRVWDTARAQDEIRHQRFRQLAGDEHGLALWWWFDRAAGEEAPDLSPHARAGRVVPKVSFAPIGAPAPYALPALPLDVPTLGDLAEVKRLRERYGQPLDRLTALWHEIRHTGRADGRTLFDDIFNPQGSVFDLWAFHLDAPIRWERTGASDQQANRQIRSRLMGALRVSHEQLDALVTILSGDGERTIALDGPYLANLYRLARLPGLLRLSAEELTRLLPLLGLRAVDSLPSFRLVGERADWMRATGIDVDELDFLANDRESARARLPYDAAAIRDTADSLRRQSSELLAGPASFVTPEVSQLQSDGLYRLLRELGVVDASGAVEPAYAPPAQLERLFFLAPAGASPDVAEHRLDMRAAAFAALADDQLEGLRTQRLISEQGLVVDQDGRVIVDPARADVGEQRLKGLFPDADSAARSALAEALARALKIQADLAARLVHLRDELHRATLAALATLVGSDPERTLGVARALAPQMTLKQLFVTLAALGGGRGEEAPIPAELVGVPGGFLYRLSKALYLAAQFELTVDETVALASRPALFGVKDLLHPSVEDLTNLHRLRELKRAFADAEGRLLALLGAEAAEVEERAAELAGWERGQIAAVAARLAPGVALNTPDGLERARAIFLIAQALGVDASFVLQLADASDLSYDFYARQSAALLEVLRARYDDEQWPRVARPIDNRLAAQRRDALLARAMLAIPPDFAGRRSPDVLSEYLLLDVQTGPEVDTSRLVQAIASAQLYVQRCLMNLERGINPASVPPEQWAWMKNYRVWEANRKVFLYPENYIEPELRDTKTPLFQELEQDLMQGEITQELVEKAYTSYLQKFVELANLKVIGSYLRVDRPGGKEGERGETLYLVGVTRSEPPTYYLRSKVDDRTWTPWRETGLSLPTDAVTPIFAFGRLFLFWVELVKQTEARPVLATSDEDKDDQGYKVKVEIGGKKIRDEVNVDVYKAAVRYSYQSASGDWSPPQTYMELGRHLEKHEAIRPEWRRVYLQRSAAVALDTMVSVDAEKFAASFSNGKLLLTPALLADLKARGLALSTGAGELDVRVLTAGHSWLIDDRPAKKRYLAQRERDALNVMPAAEHVETSVEALRIDEDTRVRAQTPVIDHASVTWELWSCFVRRDGRHLFQEAQPAGQTATLLRYAPPLLGSPGLEIAAAAAVSRDPAAPDMPALRDTREQRKAERDSAATSLKTARDDLAALKPDASDDERKKASELVSTRELNLGAAEQTLKLAQQALDEAAKKPQWQSSGVTVTVRLDGKVTHTLAVSYDTWQHIALTLSYAGGAYTASLITPQGGTTAAAPVARGSALPGGRSLLVGDPSDAPLWFGAQLSELRLWDHVRDAATIAAERGERKGQGAADLSLFVLPLSGPVAGGTVGPAHPGLSFSTLVEPSLPEERERIMLFWGDEVQRSIRNTLQNDEEFTLSLRPEEGMQPAYAVDLAASTLYLSTEARLSLNDYAVGTQTTLSRFPPDIRLIITAAMGNNYFLPPADVARIRPLLGNLSAFGKVDDVALENPLSLHPFITKRLKIPAGEYRGGNVITTTNRLLNNISSYQASFSDVNNQPGWYVVDTSDEQFLVRIVNRKAPLRTAEERLKFYYAEDGWRGEYFGNVGLSGEPALVRTDPRIDFKWGGGGPAPNLANNFSARWTRDFMLTGGLYTFAVTSDDGVRLYVDGERLLDAWQDTAEKTHPPILKELGPGWHRVVLEYYERGGDATVQLTFSGEPTVAAQASSAATRALKMYYETDPALRYDPVRPGELSIEFERLSTFAVHNLSQRLFAGGVDGLLRRDSQEVEERDFARRYQPAAVVVPPGFNRATGRVERRIDFDGANGLYYREIFFHLPFFLANQLNAAQRFEEAQRWYHYIFNPTTNEPADGANPNDRYWQFRPFRKRSLETLREMLGNRAALDAYRKDPFDPHAIAVLRLNAYQKAIVMKYIDNLLDWGDSLFMQDTREAIGEAVQLYFLAYNVLGPRPKSKPVKELNPVGSLDDVLEAQHGDLPDFVVELARQAPAADATALTPNNVVLTSFGLVENEQFLGYWDRVEDRLYKIRHSLNFEGTFRQLALFQPPIDPRALVGAVAGGRDLGSVIGDLSVPAPHYRFLNVLERAKDMAGLVKDLGGALLSALESKDAAELAALEHTHARQILDLTTAIKEREVKAAEEGLEALKINRQGLTYKRDHYKKLIDKGLIWRETTGGVLRAVKVVTKGAEGVAKTMSKFVKAAPEAETGVSGFGATPVGTITVGGKQLAVTSEAIGEGLAAAGEVLGILAEAAEKGAEYDRREEEWEHEKKMAQHELDEVEHQIAVAYLQLENARRELAIHQRTLQQHQEVAEFNRRKFTSTQLYSWMAARLAGLYFQAYKLAYAYARSAEKAMQFEMLTNQSFISFGHWDSLKKGLLAGESLLLELCRMEKWQLDQDSRYQDMEKVISMARSMPEALTALKQGGTADFQLGEALFDRDFPGHYGRMLKMIYITVKTSSEIDPFDGVHATLYQLGNKVLLEPSIDAVRYLLGVDGAEQPDAAVLRVNWRPNQQIAISKVEEDNGVFAIDFFFDNRYFPFEGTGAVSSWRLEMLPEANRFDLGTITDVVIKIGYSSKYDNGAFRQAVLGELRSLASQ